MMVTSQWIVKMNFWASAHAGMRGNMKRKIAWILLAAMTLSIAACGNKTGDPVADDGNITAEATEGELDTSANLEGSCADILDEIYKTAKTDDDYFSYTDDFENVEITEAEEEYILGTTEIDYTDSVYSAPMMSSIAYQCVLLRVSEDQDIEAAKKLLEENADPAKWICGEAERCCGKRWRRDFIHHGRQRCCRCSKRSVFSVKKINTEGGAKLAFFKYYVFILFFTGGISDLLSGTGKSEKSDTVSGKLRFLFVGGAKIQCAAPFFCYSRLYGFSGRQCK